MTNNWKVGDTVSHPKDKIDLKIVNTYKAPEGEHYVNILLSCSDSDQGLTYSASQKRLESEGYQKHEN
jgi:hypothetical protein